MFKIFNMESAERDSRESELRALREAIDEAVVLKVEMDSNGSDSMFSIGFGKSSLELKKRVAKWYGKIKDWNKIVKKLEKEYEKQLEVHKLLCSKEKEQAKEHEKDRIISELREELRKMEMRKFVGYGNVRRTIMRCFLCGKMGHVVRYCPNNMSKRNEYISVSSNYNKRLKRQVIYSKDVLIKKYNKLFNSANAKIKFCRLEKCKIETPNNVRIVKKGCITPQAEKEDANKIIKDYLDRGIIRRSSSEWRNPIRFIRKPNGSLRLVSNLMALNKEVKKDEFSLRNIREIINATSGSKFFSVLDLKEAFYNIEIEEKDKEKTAFEFEGQLYEWNSMVMGYKNAPQLMQRVMNKIFGDLKNNGVEVYIDDVIVYSKYIDTHNRLLDIVCKRLLLDNMTFNESKIVIGKDECKRSVKQ